MVLAMLFRDHFRYFPGFVPDSENAPTLGSIAQGSDLMPDVGRHFKFGWCAILLRPLGAILIYEQHSNDPPYHGSSMREVMFVTGEYLVSSQGNYSESDVTQNVNIRSPVSQFHNVAKHSLYHQRLARS